MESDEDEYDSFDDDEGVHATKQGLASEVERVQGFSDITIRHSPVLVRYRMVQNAATSLAALGC